MSLNTSLVNDPTIEVTTQTIFPQEQSTQHQDHHTHYRCVHSKNNSTKLNSQINENRFTHPHVLLSNQHVRDQSDVYRREKDFLNENIRHCVQNSITPLPPLIESFSSPEDHLPEQFFYLPCHCHTSPFKRFCQSNLSQFLPSLSLSVCLSLRSGQWSENDCGIRFVYCLCHCTS